MGRIIIIFSSNSGTDLNNWRSFLTNKNVQWGNPLEIGNGNKMYIFNGTEFSKAGYWVFKDIREKVNSVVNQNTNCDYAILFHTQRNSDLNNLRIHCVNIVCAKFSTVLDIWTNYIQPLFNASNLQDPFNALWNKIYGKSPEDLANQAHKLRAEILTPFIPFHLFHEVAKGKKEEDKNKLVTEWEGIFRDCCEAINGNREKNVEGIKDKFDNILKIKPDLPVKLKSSAGAAFKGLIANFPSAQIDCIKAKDCRGKIQKFADCLENIVNFIEFGEVANCQD